MHVSDTFPELQKQRALVIVTGTQVGRIYRLSSGELTQIASIDIPTPRYSDREGFFFRSKGGARLGSGSTYETPKESVRQTFLKELQNHVQAAVRSATPEAMYLFAPLYTKNATRTAVTAAAGDVPCTTFMGNYTKNTPDRLLSKVHRHLTRAD